MEIYKMNTVMTAKSTFSEGLVMDFSPDNTQASVLTSALNATLLTFNGNEMALQNDMGNARVESAYLPEGYIPVGTCEFGDIIYIVSYNPLINKSQIGCFPSPERNISSDELHDNIENQILSNSDFMEYKTDSGLNPILESGRVKANSVRKILMNKKINPGDKFVIFDKSKGSIHKEVHVSDVGNTDHEFGGFPKLLKVHVVSINDSGKIDFLDSDVKWYQMTDAGSKKDYFILNQVEGSNGTPDIDSYRTSISSGYSIFQSKVSGKLALLVELERIDSFSCTYNVVKGSMEDSTYDVGTIKYQDYNVYLNINWGTSDYNINPSAICLYDQKWTGVNSDLAGKAILWNKVSEKEYGLHDNIQEVDYPSVKEKELKSFMQCWNEDDFSQKYYTKEISRGYKQESDNILYDDFKKSKSYQRILDKSLDAIRLTQYAGEGGKKENPDDSWSEDIGVGNIKIYPSQLKQYDNVKDIALTKINLSELGSSTYYVNAHETIIEEKEEGEEGKRKVEYYTSYKNKNIKIHPYQINDDIINNYFGHSVSKYFGKFSIPVKQIFDGPVKELAPDISNLIYNYEVAPMMPYGVLPDLKVSGYINFSKLGSGEINLTQWKYYNTENVSTLTLGLDVFPEENKGVNAVILEFIDNQGVAANYILNNNSSYSGVFTDNLPLNGSFQNYKFTGTDINGNPIYHAGQEDENGTVYRGSTDPQKYSKQRNGAKWDNFEPKKGDELIQIDLFSEKPSDGYYTAKIRRDTETIEVGTTEATTHINDAGTIYSNFLYLVKITVQYCSKDALGNYDTTRQDEFKTFYRWMWTNTMYNDKYYNVLDFDTLLLELNTDVGVSYSTNSNYNLQVSDSIVTSNEADLNVPFKNFGTTVQEIIGDENIQVDITPGLQETYNTFSLSSEIASDLRLIIYKGNSYITSEGASVTSINGKYEKDSDVLHPERLLPAREEEKPSITNTNWDDQSYKELPNWQNLDIGSDVTYSKGIEYINYLGEVVTIQNAKYVTLDMKNLLEDKFDWQFTYNAMNFSNFYQYYTQTSEDIPTYAPIVHDLTSAMKYGFVRSNQAGMGTDSKRLVLKRMIHLAGGDYVDGAPYPTRSIILSTTEDQSRPTVQKKIDHLNTSTNQEPRDRSILTRFDGIFGENDLDYGFCAIRFFSRRGTTDLTPTPESDNGYLLGSTAKDTQFGNNFSNLNDYNFYFTYIDKGDHKLYYRDSENRLFLLSKITSNLIFPAFVDSDKNLYLINNYVQVDQDHLLYPKWSQTSEDAALQTSLNRISDFILDTLTQLYVKTDVKTQVPIVSDVIYLRPHSVVYTYDVLYSLLIEQPSSSYLCLQGIVLQKYVEQVKNNLEGITNINDNNILVNLRGTLKNAPISIEFTTKEPTMNSTSSIAIFKDVLDVWNTKESNLTQVQLDEYGSQFYYKKNGKYVAYNWIGTFPLLSRPGYYSKGEEIRYFKELLEDEEDEEDEGNYMFSTISQGFQYNNQLSAHPDFNNVHTIAQNYIRYGALSSTGTLYITNVEYVSWSNIYGNMRLYTHYTFFNQ